MNVLQDLQQPATGQPPEQPILSSSFSGLANENGVNSPAALLAQLRLSSPSAQPLATEKDGVASNAAGTKSKKTAAKPDIASAANPSPANAGLSSAISALSSFNPSPVTAVPLLSTPQQSQGLAAVEDKSTTKAVAAAIAQPVDVAFAVKLTSKSQTSAEAFSETANGAAREDSATGGKGSSDNSDNSFSSEAQAAAALTATKASTIRANSLASAVPLHEPGSDKPVTVAPGELSTVQNRAADMPPDAAKGIKTEASEPAASASAAALKDIQVRVNGADDTRVDLRMIERSGSLSISVRTPDAALTKSLQQGLPELANKIAEIQPMRAEWWTPEGPKAASPQGGGQGSTGGHTSHTSDQGSNNRDSSGRRGERDQPKPDWIDELTSQQKSNQNGKNFVWHL